MKAPALLLHSLLYVGAAELGATALADCKLEVAANLPVTLHDLKPLINGKINGADAVFVLDSGAFNNWISPAAAEQFHLKTQLLPGWSLQGVGGKRIQMYLTSIEDLRLESAHASHADFVVGGGDIGYGAVGLIGQNVLTHYDVEYDFATGHVRLLKATGCSGTMLAYWVPPSQPYSVMPISEAQDATIGYANVNGTKIRVQLDTGADLSILDLRAANHAGVTPQSEGVTAAGAERGLGPNFVTTWIAPFASFKLGDEEVRNTRLRIGSIALPKADMLLGADFFLSHHVYVSNSQHKLYFTYNGGPVFNLNPALTAQIGASPESAPSGPATTNPAAPSSVSSNAGPSDSATSDVTTPGTTPPSSAAGSAASPVTSAADEAAALARTGAAFSARRDFVQALADLNRACELQPAESHYFYLRGMAHWGNRQLPLASADFDQAIKLNPGEVDALMARAQLHWQDADKTQLMADLSAVDRFVAPEADIRFNLARLFLTNGAYAPAVSQFDLWIAVHGADSRLAAALDGRCRGRAMLNRELDKALSDCNAALRRSPHEPAFLDGRGLVRLRMADWKDAIADYSAALELRPNIATSLYGRGLAEIRTGLNVEGQADIAAATTISPGIVMSAQQDGLAP